MLSKVFFHYAFVETRLRDSKQLKLYIPKIFERYNCKISRIDYIFCSDEYLASINKEFLKHDYFTDIITFSFNAKKLPILAEIYISVERVVENSVIYNLSVKEEMLRVIFHGALHLCGLSDNTAYEKKNMRKKENSCIADFYVSRETVSRGTINGPENTNKITGIK